ncbi:contactin-associated protein-like 4 [Plectropomus leopardus]|uniref:contactin-associated protein-like 4 n=1 Tax=Plectropomus leopardus TaxID=160734 RepID=UPI001C4BB817|nr:contactin-associated protein-like 4 [Plectropomus leopardus]
MANENLRRVGSRNTAQQAAIVVIVVLVLAMATDGDEQEEVMSCLVSESAELSAAFRSGTSVSYAFKEPSELNRSAPPSSIHSDTTLRAENVSLSFRTNRSPAPLLHVASDRREYLTLLLNKHDMLEVRYRLDGSRDAQILRSKVRNLANGQLHAVTVSRRADAVSVQIDQNTREDFNLTSDVAFNGPRSLVLGRVQDSRELDPELSRIVSLGFTGCLSAVLFNAISPLKAALLQPDSSPVSVTGPLLRSNCGSTSANPHAAEPTHHLSGRSGSAGTGQPLVDAIKSDSALIGGVIAVVIFVTVSASAVTARVLYRRKGTSRSQEVKTVKPEDSPERTLRGHSGSHGGQSNDHKEYFI